MAGINVHDAKLEVAKRASNPASRVDRNLLSCVWIDSNLPAEEQQISAVAAQGEIEYTGVLEKELPFLRKEELEWSEIKLLGINVGISEVSISGEIRYQIRAEAELNIDASGREGTHSWSQACTCGAWWQMTKTGQAIR